MTYTPVKIYQGQPTTSEAWLYESTTGSRIIKQLVVTNTGAATSVLNLSLMPSGGTAGVTNRIIAALSVPAGTTLVFDFTQVMNNGDVISGIQSVTGALTLTISGVSY